MNPREDNNRPMCDNTVPTRTQGKVEESLDNLYGAVNKLEKLAENLVDKLSYPVGVPCCNLSEKSDREPTLYQRISTVQSRIDDANARLELANEIVNRNLGAIKLD